jgi:ATP adenylyltransferase
MAEYQRNLWAPWRMEYIRSLEGGSDGCFLCDYLASPENDAENYVLWRDARTLVLLNRFPYSSGHVLIAPVEHVGRFDGLASETMLAIMERARDVQRVLREAIKAQGFNVGFNIGHCAGAGLPDHVHCHVVPRWSGDTNYMAVLPDVKVIPESLRAVAEHFHAAAKDLNLPAQA